jgi:peptide/nickel transport system ATP-binding protein
MTKASTQPVLDISHLSVALPSSGDRRHAVIDLSVTIQPGEIVCVVGESGSGKSVTAQAIMGLLPKGQLVAERGTIALQGEDVLQATPDRLRELRGTRMAMIFQEPMTALNPVLTVGNQIAEMLAIHTDLTAAEQRARVLEMMQAVHLPDVERMIDCYPHQLSGGQRQRIMIAQALILDPALLIADEPTTALDVTTQAQILKLIKEMQERRGTGVLFITHDFGVVADIADRVVVMQHGNLVESGTRDEVPSLVPPQREPARGPIALQTINLGKTYQGTGGFLDKQRVVKAADQVNLSLRRGETLGVVGESGSGKSTVARCIARLIDPSEGQILLDGLDIAHLPERHCGRIAAMCR